MRSEQKQSHCCICLEEQRGKLDHCKVCNEGGVCPDCRMELMEEGYSNCPTCRGPRFSITRVATRSNVFRPATTAALMTTRRQRRQRRLPDGLCYHIEIFLRMFVFIFCFEFLALGIGYFTCVFLGAFNSTDSISILILLLIGNVSLVLLYGCLVFFSHVSQHDRRHRIGVRRIRHRQGRS